MSGSGVDSDDVSLFLVSIPMALDRGLVVRLFIQRFSCGMFIPLSFVGDDLPSTSLSLWGAWLIG